MPVPIPVPQFTTSARTCRRNDPRLVTQVEVLRRENGKVLKENSALHMEIIRKDEECDERMRAGAAAARKLDDQITELRFWKQQHIERYLDLEKVHVHISTLYTVHLAPCTLHPAPCTLHPAPCTLHPAPCALRPAPCILHPAPTPCTLHPAPCTLHPAPCTLHLEPHSTLNPDTRTL